ARQSELKPAPLRDHAQAYHSGQSWNDDDVARGVLHLKASPEREKPASPLTKEEARRKQLTARVPQAGGGDHQSPGHLGLRPAELVERDPTHHTENTLLTRTHENGDSSTVPASDRSKSQEGVLHLRASPEKKPSFMSAEEEARIARLISRVPPARKENYRAFGSPRKLELQPTSLEERERGSVKSHEKQYVDTSVPSEDHRSTYASRRADALGEDGEHTSRTTSSSTTFWRRTITTTSGGSNIVEPYSTERKDQSGAEDLTFNRNRIIAESTHPAGSYSADIKDRPLESTVASDRDRAVPGASHIVESFTTRSKEQSPARDVASDRDSALRDDSYHLGSYTNGTKNQYVETDVPSESDLLVASSSSKTGRSQGRMMSGEEFVEVRVDRRAEIQLEPAFCLTGAGLGAVSENEDGLFFSVTPPPMPSSDRSFFSRLFKVRSLIYAHN
ncbi:unnamed protein product, partial [Strongylus vulgaris]